MSVVPPIAGLTGPDALGPADGVHTLHTMGDVHAVMDTLHRRDAATAVVVGAGYIGLEMAEALTARGCAVTQIEALPQVLPTLDPERGQLVRAELTAHGIEVLTATTVSSIAHASATGPALVVRAEGAEAAASPARATSSLSWSGSTPTPGLPKAAERSLASRARSRWTRSSPEPDPPPALLWA